MNRTLVLLAGKALRYRPFVAERPYSLLSPTARVSSLMSPLD
jgi:hypothetical protein